MAFPSVRSYNTSRVDSNGTSHSVTMPATISAGDLLIVFFSSHGNGVTISIDTGVSGNNWSKNSNTSSDASTTTMIWKLSATGSDALTLTTNASEKSTAISYCISGHGGTNLDFNSTTGSSTNINPPSSTPSYTTRDYLWITYGSTDNMVEASAAPTNFTDLHTIRNTTTGIGSSSSQRNLTRGMTAYDPGSFTSATSDWNAFTVCINPGSPIGLSVGNIAFNENTVL